MRKSFRYKAKLSQSAVENAENQLRLCCELYNAALQERRDAYRMCGLSISRFDQIYQLPEVKRLRPDIAVVGSQVLCDVIDRVDRAFEGFFARLKKGDKPGYPRFKSFRRYDSITFRQCGWKLTGNRLRLQGIGTLRLRLSREIEGKVKTVTLRRDGCGDWLVAFSCDDVPSCLLPDTNSAVGIDVGIEAFATLSTGGRVESPRIHAQAQTDLRRAARRVARRKKGSNRRRKAVRLLAKKHRRIERIRRDFHFKTARKLVQHNDVIAVEDLNIRGLSRSMLAKHVNDAGWGQFIEILTFKAEEAGRQIVKVNPAGTSQVCSDCGCEPKERKALGVRIHECPECGYTTHRDHNAARNILHLGLKQTGRADLSASGHGCKRAA